MYISKLEILGFKSFATKTVLKFGSGITAVIGPNGCGKSNVVDAIRWVLGEQKTHLLRSEQMVDVIFSGSRNRKPLNYAEVTLTIHNDDGQLGIAYTDVQVGRRLYRDGSSEYLLNEVPVRLKDIQNLFIDTGMNTNAYSVIEQRMVEEILNEDKSQRKMLFEEAAGINKYKTQRKSALRKLDATKEDLARLEDILFEVDSKVRSLKRQLGSYERYEGYAEELQKLEIMRAQAKWYAYEEAIAPLEKQLSSNQLQNEETGRQLGIEEAMLDSYKKELTCIEVLLQESNDALQELNEKINAESSKRLVLQEKIANAQRNKERLALESEEARTRLQHNLALRENLSGQLGEDDPELGAMRKALDEAKETFAGVQELFRKAGERLEDLRRELRGHQDRLSDIQQQQLRLRDRKKQLGNLQDEEIRRREELVLRSEKQSAQTLSLEKALQDAAKGLAGTNESLEKEEQRRRSLETALRELEPDILHKESALERNRNEAEFYEGLIESLEGYDPGVRYVMKTLKHPGIRGTVADLLKVDKPYTAAIEIALGNVSRYLVAETRADAMDVIEELKRSQRGRVSIAALDLMRERLKDPIPNPYNDGNFLAHAVDVVHAVDGDPLLVHYFLGNLLIVRSLRELSDAALRDARFRYVTPDGDYLDQRAMIRGGRTARQDKQVIGRRDKIRELDESAEVLKKEIENLKAERDRRENERREAQKAVTELSRESRSRMQAHMELEKKMSALSYAVSHQHADIEEIDRKITDYGERILQIDAEIDATGDALKTVTAQEAGSAAELEKFRNEYEAIHSRYDALNAELQDMRVALIAREKEKDNIRFQYKNALATIEEMETKLRSAEKENGEHEVFIADAGREMQALQTVLEDLRRHREEQREKRDAVYKTLSAKREQIRDVEEAISERHRKREDVFETLRDLQVRVNDLYLRRDQLKERIFERYHIDILKRPYEAPDMEMEEMEDKIHRLSARIEAIGPVNMAVREEYNEQAARLAFLKEQKEDLTGAEADITQTIEKLDTEARRQFTEVFSQIRENYKKTYKLFFEQGECDLRLEGSSDPLDADIEIFSRPKGKQMKSLRALSGGEKALTAISLLFAIYLVKPSPYCILDEVDAPLDDTNVKRFTRALEHFTAKTQFIIVTHNKLTMNACDYLYGVTMQEEGVSSIVSVRFRGDEVETVNEG
ncbi:MAG: chromosome segregation protein SMC [Candidatus Marinimicrobia bacterium]|nr:chromosome segregation protein SMC [Candidatus Neomarinimicrobiota bacterium]